YQHEAVEMVMQYIRSTVSYSLQSSSNPADVLRTGKAYCEGYANAAALMLRTIGIPAKVVDSYIPPGHMWGYGQEGSGGYHAHVEV
ncbi:MAG: transglutaminase-like domain-containing protein, partial [Sediminispirochaetaceae bacterium]